MSSSQLEEQTMSFTRKKKNNTIINETNMKLLTGGRSNEQCKKNKRGTNSLLWFAVNVPK